MNVYIGAYPTVTAKQVYTLEDKQRDLLADEDNLRRWTYKAIEDLAKAHNAHVATALSDKSENRRSLEALADQNTAYRRKVSDLLAAISADVQANPGLMEKMPETATVVTQLSIENMREEEQDIPF